MALHPTCPEPKMSLSSSCWSSLHSFAVCSDHFQREALYWECGGSYEILLIFCFIVSLSYHVLSLKQRQYILSVRRRGKNKLKFNIKAIIYNCPEPL